LQIRRFNGGETFYQQDCLVKLSDEDDKYGSAMGAAAERIDREPWSRMRVTIAACSAVVSLALAGEAVPAASEYPNHTVKIIVPTSPGAVTDALARACQMCR
jgi:hypothetical protein